MHVDDINSYVLSLVRNGTRVLMCKKRALVTAVRGTIGEVISTDIDDTANTVGVDEYGNPDWVVTNPGGEKYVVHDNVFQETYEQYEGSKYRKKVLQLLVQCTETTEFTPPWGGSFTVNAGGYFTINGYNDIAGIQEEAFSQTYDIVSESQSDIQDAINILTNAKGE